MECNLQISPCYQLGSSNFSNTLISAEKKKYGLIKRKNGLTTENKWIMTHSEEFDGLGPRGAKGNPSKVEKSNQGSEIFFFEVNSLRTKV